MPRKLTPYTVVTYRYVRIAMVAVLVMIAASVIIESIWSRCVLGSVSSYYYTPVQTVFVGALFAFGAALIAYQGHSDPEDDMLNLSGLMAFVVAIVPTVRDGSCQITDAAVPVEGPSIGMTNNIVSLLIAGGIAVVIARTLADRANKRSARIPAGPKGRPNRTEPGKLMKLQLWISDNWTTLRKFLWVVPILEVASFAVFPNQLSTYGHAISAITMVVGLILVMFFNAWFSEVRREDPSRKYRRRYQAMAVILIFAVVVTSGLASVVGENLLILLLEFVILGIFVVYWLFQTSELWDYVVDADDMPDGLDSNSSSPGGAVDGRRQRADDPQP